MKTISIMFLFAALMAGVAGSGTSSQAMKQIITYSDLVSGRVEVTGAFDIPLGKVFTIEATLVRARDTLGAMYNNAFMLAVDAVNGRKLEQQKRIFFRVKDVATKLPEGIDELESWKTEELKRSLTSDEREELVAGYLGRHYKLSVVEDGSFSGVPKNLPEDCVIWAGEKYQFSTTLVVLAGK